jgi:phosphocarrier protein HPr
LKAAGSAWLFHPNGLHARPAIKLTKLAKRFRSSVAVGLSPSGPWIDAKSIAKVMAMKTPSQVTLFFEAEGSDAPETIEALVALVASDFAAPGDGLPAIVPPA